MRIVFQVTKCHKSQVDFIVLVQMYGTTYCGIVELVIVGNCTDTGRVELYGTLYLEWNSITVLLL